MYSHFLKIAPSYKDIRTTDIEPILFIKENLKDFTEIKAVDIGCGAGRYDLLFFQHLKNLYLTCIDINESMLMETSNYLKNNGITDFKTMKSDVNELQLENHSMDCIFTFNAIHHFDFIKLIKNAERAIKKTGLIFIYTRLRSQNARSIWGQHFPLFTEKETRLYELYEMKQWIKSVDSLRLETAKSFKCKRNTTLKQLVEKVKTKHYSTFSLYKENELDEALRIFQKNIKRHFHDTNKIEWFAENILLILKPK